MKFILKNGATWATGATNRVNAIVFNNLLYPNSVAQAFLQGATGATKGNPNVFSKLMGDTPVAQYSVAQNSVAQFKTAHFLMGKAVKLDAEPCSPCSPSQNWMGYT